MTEPSGPPETDLALARLERRAARDRAARLEAETIAENQLRRAYTHAREVELLAAIAVVVTEASNLEAAWAGAARAIRRHCGFAVAHVLVADDDGGFVTSDIWDADAAHMDFLDEVITATVDARFVPPHGLPGQVASTHLAGWLPDLATAENFLRGAAIRSGSAWAFPVLSGVEVVAVLEFLDPAPRGADERLLTLAGSLGATLGRAVDLDRLQTARAADRRRLEELVASQSVALASAQREGVVAEQARAAFVAHLLHDLLADVRRARSALEVGESEDVGTVTELLERVDQTSTRLLAVVESTPGTPMGDRVATRPYELVRAVADLVTAAGGPHIDVRRGDGATIELDLPAPLVERSVRELLDNAVYHSGSREIEVRVGLQGPAGPLVVLVRDHGVGFAWPRDLMQLTGGGGLAQVARIAEALGGALTVDPAPGGGTRAELRVAARTAAVTPRRLANGRVLVVDDNEVNRRLAAAMLAKAGLSADVVDSGAGALEALAASSYGVVLMDVQMPGLDGRETTRAWRSGAGGATSVRVPIVALTAHVGQDERDACTAAGMDDYLSKPFGIDALTAICRRWLGTDQP